MKIFEFVDKECTLKFSFLGLVVLYIRTSKCRRECYPHGGYKYFALYLGNLVAIFR